QRFERAFISFEFNDRPLPPQIWLRAEFYLGSGNISRIIDNISFTDRFMEQGILASVVDSGAALRSFNIDGDLGLTRDVTGIEPPRQEWVCMEMFSSTSSNSMQQTEIYWNSRLRASHDYSVGHLDGLRINVGIIGRFEGRNKNIPRGIFVDDVRISSEREPCDL
ncbi:MAG: hypothetical protein AAF449_19750, partial [Myxococcota bacterium]